MQPTHKNDVVQDVKCSVKNCYFNDCGGKCTAGEIEVSACSGEGCEGTLCATFVDKERCDSCF